MENRPQILVLTRTTRTAWLQSIRPLVLSQDGFQIPTFSGFEGPDKWLIEHNGLSSYASASAPVRSERALERDEENRLKALGLMCHYMDSDMRDHYAYFNDPVLLYNPIRADAAVADQFKAPELNQELQSFRKKAG